MGFIQGSYDNVSLSDMDKFNYLRSLLEHIALDAISRLTLIAANYQEAVLILEKNDFETNKKLWLSIWMDALINVDVMTSPHNIKGLHHLYEI